MDATLTDDQGRKGADPHAVLIAGPTASGKSALALRLAERTNGVILNADSMQVYAELRLVSARPSAEDEARAEHRLYGVLPAATPFSTGDWLKLVAREISAVRAEGRLPILVGGTGLYFKALTEGLAVLPEIQETVRSACRVLADEQGVDGVRAALAPLDPQAAATVVDLQRLTRALEVVQSTGRTLADWHRETQSPPLLAAQSCVLRVLAPPRPWLHERIAQRADLMLGEEGIAEVEALLAKGLPWSLPAMRAIGVKEIAALLAGEIDRPEAHRRLVVATRRYAKRQETWFRNQMADWPRVDPTDEAALADALRVGR